MTTLTVKDFSCVDEAEIQLAQLTVLIGPQASGKSVISKLVYFFYDILNRQFSDLEDEQTLEEFRSALSDEFKKWFQRARGACANSKSHSKPVPS